MKKLFIILGIAVTLIGCNKDEETTLQENTEEIIDKSGIYSVSCCLNTDYLIITFINGYINIEGIGTGEIEENNTFVIGSIAVGEVISNNEVLIKYAGTPITFIKL